MSEIEGEWRSLFDGETLGGWQATGVQSQWEVDDNAILCHGIDPIRNTRADQYDGTTYLFTADRFEDFEFEFEYRIEEDGNSGIYFRWSELTDRQTGMEIQILDVDRYDEVAQNTTGALYDMQAPTTDPAEPYPTWNTVRLRCDGPIIRVWINDEQVLEADIDEWDTPGKNPDGTDNKFTGYAMRNVPRNGRLALQHHDEQCWFRNLRIREL